MDKMTGIDGKVNINGKIWYIDRWLLEGEKQTSLAVTENVFLELHAMTPKGKVKVIGIYLYK